MAGVVFSQQAQFIDIIQRNLPYCLSDEIIQADIFIMVVPPLLLWFLDTILFCLICEPGSVFGTPLMNDDSYSLMFIPEGTRGQRTSQCSSSAVVCIVFPPMSWPHLFTLTCVQVGVSLSRASWAVFYTRSSVPPEGWSNVLHLLTQSVTFLIHSGPLLHYPIVLSPEVCENCHAGASLQVNYSELSKTQSSVKCLSWDCYTLLNLRTTPFFDVVMWYSDGSMLYPTQETLSNACRSLAVKLRCWCRGDELPVSIARHAGHLLSTTNVSSGTKCQ